jgi:chromosome segregation ATPase
VAELRPLRARAESLTLRVAELSQCAAAGEEARQAAARDREELDRARETAAALRGALEAARAELAAAEGVLPEVKVRAQAAEREAAEPERAQGKEAADGQLTALTERCDRLQRKLSRPWAAQRRGQGPCIGALAPLG